MSISNTSPSSLEAASPEAVPDEQVALANAARDEVQAFLESPAEKSHDAAEAALAAMKEAVDADVSLEALSAALETSPKAVRAIVDHNIDLEQLHPDQNAD